MIEGMLAEDRETWRKQRHTATRIHERLRDGYGAGVSLSTVTRTVARLRREAAAEREAGLVVPERLRTLDHGRPWRDDQFAACRVSSSRDMSR
ncbi:hypothetical protein MCC00231_18730 [Bifidobacterium longum subsp. longum]|nr:hypothetical protein MCC00231_18730 [Bifidobacterium longum subsp. longum]